MWVVNVNNIVFSNLIEANNNSNYLIGYSVIRQLLLISPKMSGYFKTFEIRDGDKDKNNKLMIHCINNEKLLKNYSTIWTKIEDLNNIKLNAAPVYIYVFVYI